MPTYSLSVTDAQLDAVVSAAKTSRVTCRWYARNASGTARLEVSGSAAAISSFAANVSALKVKADLKRRSGLEGIRGLREMRRR